MGQTMKNNRMTRQEIIDEIKNLENQLEKLNIEESNKNYILEKMMLDEYGLSRENDYEQGDEYDWDRNDSSQYCKHGNFIGSWWGPDILCGACESE